MRLGALNCYRVALLILPWLFGVLPRKLVPGRRRHTLQMLHQEIKAPPKKVRGCPGPAPSGGRASPAQRMIFVRQRKVFEVLVGFHEGIHKLQRCRNWDIFIDLQ